MTARKISRREQLFVAEYLISLNGTKAAIAAGYAEKSAYRRANKLLYRERVREAIEAGMRARIDRLEFKQDDVLRELARLGFANMADFMKVDENGAAYVDLSNLDRAQAAAIGEVVVEEFVDGKGEEKRNVRRTKFKLLDKKGALDSIARHFGMFNDKLNLTTPGQTHEEWLEDLHRASKATPTEKVIKH